MLTKNILQTKLSVYYWIIISFFVCLESCNSEQSISENEIDRVSKKGVQFDNATRFLGNWIRVLDKEGFDLKSSNLIYRLNISMSTNGYYLVKIDLGEGKYQPLYFGSGKFERHGNLLFPIGKTQNFDLPIDIPSSPDKNPQYLHIPEFGFFIKNQ